MMKNIAFKTMVGLKIAVFLQSCDIYDLVALVGLDLKFLKKGTKS